MISLNTQELTQSLELLYKAVENHQETKPLFLIIQVKNGKLSLTVKKEYRLTFSINCISDQDLMINVPYIHFFAITQQIKSDQVNLMTVGNLLKVNDYLVNFFPEIEETATNKIEDATTSTTKNKSKLFSQFNTIEGSFRVSGSFLGDAIKKIAFATSKEDSMRVLQAIALHPEYICALDGHRAAQIMIADTVTIHDRPIEFFDFISMLEIIENTINIDVVVEEHSTKLIGNNWEYERKPEGAYPNLNQLIPVCFLGHTTTKRLELIATIERIMGTSKTEDLNVIKVTAGYKEIILETGSIHNSNKRKEIIKSATIESGDTRLLKLAFNAKYLWEALKNLDQDTITINWCSDRIIISEQNMIDDKGNVLTSSPLKNKFLIMPVKIADLESTTAIADTTTKAESTTAIADTTTKAESTTAIADTTTKAESTTAIADTATVRKVREDGHLIPIAGDKVYTYTGGMFGASKWTATVIKINEDGKTMQIKKDWQKTKSGKPGRMTVNIDTWKVEDDPQYEVERQKAKEEKMKEEAEEKAKNMAAKEATEKAYNDAIASGKEIPFDVKKAKKGDVITTYCENTYMGNCSIYKYKYRELREDGETILASPIQENGRASSAQLCVGSIKRGKITILKSEKKTDRKPEKKNYYCDRQWALSGVSPWVDARLTNTFNQIDDYPHDFNKNRERMIEGLENWKYQQKYRLTEIDIKRIDYVIKCFS